MTFFQVQVPTDLPVINQRDGEINTDFSKILSLLEKKLPKSCFIYNAVKISPRFPQHSKIFYVNPGTESCGIRPESWIIVTHFTEDIGQMILISGPSPNITPSDQTTLLQLFSTCPDSILNWEEPHWFVALEPELARLIIQINVEVKGHQVQVYPDTLAYIDQDDRELKSRLNLKLVEVTRRCPHLEIKGLDPISGTEFISSTWKYASENTHLPVSRYLKNNESAGVYLKGDTSKGPLSGLLLNGLGLISMLHTVEEERGKGYAKLGIQSISRDLLASGLYPASSVEVWNKASLGLHFNLGFKLGGDLVWVSYTPTSS